MLENTIFVSWINSCDLQVLEILLLASLSLGEHEERTISFSLLFVFHKVSLSEFKRCEIWADPSKNLELRITKLEFLLKRFLDLLGITLDDLRFLAVRILYSQVLFEVPSA